jgi:ribosomal protein L11 methyltransferase
MVRYVLSGEASARAAALERIHVHCAVRAVFDGDAGTEVDLVGAMPACDDLGARVTTLDDDDSPHLTGFEHDVAIRISDRLLVRPPWVEVDPDFSGIELVVPRGMAFGSGEHGSTQAALTVLDAAWPTPAPPSVLDVGTGSGILARYALQRGAGRIAACDIEAESVAACRALVPGADVREGGPERFAPDRFDLVVANLDARQLGAALAAIRARWTGRGPLVLSGLCNHEVDPLLARLEFPPRWRVECRGYVALGWSGA